MPTVRPSVTYAIPHLPTPPFWRRGCDSGVEWVHCLPESTPRPRETPLQVKINTVTVAANSSDRFLRRPTVMNIYRTRAASCCRRHAVLLDKSKQQVWNRRHVASSVHDSYVCRAASQKSRRIFSVYLLDVLLLATLFVSLPDLSAQAPLGVFCSCLFRRIFPSPNPITLRPQHCHPGRPAAGRLATRVNQEVEYREDP